MGIACLDHWNRSLEHTFFKYAPKKMEEKRKKLCISETQKLEEKGGNVT